MAKMLRRGKKDKKATTQTAKDLTTLEQICGDDKETYEALRQVMFLDPRKIDTTTAQALDNAKKAEKEKNMARAKMCYRVAGGLALFEGNTKKVVEYYGEAARISGEKYLILNNPEKAVAKAQEYYKQQLHS